MARVQVSRVAVEDLDRLIEAKGLPPDTRDRLMRSLSVLETFPRAGRELVGRWAGFRFWIGPWAWMIILYEYRASSQTVAVVAIHDGRASSAATGEGA